MDATIVVHVQPRDAVPEGAERVAWLERYGVPPESADVSVTLPLAEWARLRAPITPDGRVGQTWVGQTWAPDAPYWITHGIEVEALRQVRETGAVPESLTAADAIRALTAGAIDQAIRGPYDHGGDNAYVEHDRWLAARAAEALVAERTRIARESIDREGPSALLMQAPDAEPGSRWYLVADLGRPTSAEQVFRSAATKEELAAARLLARERNAADLAAYQAAVATYLAAHGTPSQQARWADHLLPVDELRDVIRDTELGPLADLPRYKKIPAGEVEHGGDCYEADIETEVSAAEALSESEYSALQRYRSLAPKGAVVEAREHAVWCRMDSCPNKITRRSALVSVSLLGEEVSREYAL